MDILYRPLAEILLLHEFYVTDSKLASVFDVADQTARMLWLSDNYDQSEPSVMDDLPVIPDARTAAVLRNQHMRLVPTNWGFLVAVRVTKGIRPDTTPGFQPMIPIPANLSLVFLLQNNNYNLNGFTNGRLARSTQAAYYFSNQDCPDPKTSPFLANAVSAYDPAYSYEMGELSLNGGALQQATASGIAPTQAPLTNSGFISENDRLLLPYRFYYSFAATDSVTQATFTLTDPNGNVVTTVTQGSTAAGAPLLQKAFLDFTGATPALDPMVIGEGGVLPLYRLGVAGNGGYAKQVRILFYPGEQVLQSCWGAVELLPTVKTAAFNLIDQYGFLVPPPGGTAPDHPVFEIRVKSRLAFWRYNPNADGVALATNADTNNYLVASGSALVTKAPRICTYTPTLFTVDNINYDNLPNPVYGSVLAQTGNQFFKDIWVQKSDLFS
jgi:hypothetical protein